MGWAEPSFPEKRYMSNIPPPTTKPLYSWQFLKNQDRNLQNQQNQRYRLILWILRQLDKQMELPK